MPITDSYAAEQLEAVRVDTHSALNRIIDETQDVLLGCALTPVLCLRSTARDDVYREICRAMTAINGCRYDAAKQQVETLNGIYDIKSRVRAQLILIKYATLWTIADCLRKTFRLDVSDDERPDADIALNLACKLLKSFATRHDGTLLQSEFVSLQKINKFIGQKLTLANRRGIGGNETFRRFLSELEHIGNFASLYSVLLTNSRAWTNSDDEANDIECSVLPQQGLYLMLARAAEYFSDVETNSEISTFIPAIDLINAQHVRVCASLPIHDEYAKHNELAYDWYRLHAQMISKITNSLVDRRHLPFSQYAALIKPITETGRTTQGLCFGLALLYGAAEQLSPARGGRQLLTKLTMRYANSPYEKCGHGSVGGALRESTTTRRWFLHVCGVEIAQESQGDERFHHLFLEPAGRERASADVARLLRPNVAYALSSCCVTRGLRAPPHMAPEDPWHRYINGHAAFIQRNDDGTFHFFDPNLGVYEDQSEVETVRCMNLSLGRSCLGDDIGTYGWRTARRLDSYLHKGANWNEFLTAARSILADERLTQKIWHENGTRIDIRYVEDAHSKNRPGISATVIVDRCFEWIESDISPDADVRAVGLRAYDAWCIKQAASPALRQQTAPRALPSTWPLKVPLPIPLPASKRPTPPSPASLPPTSSELFCTDVTGALPNGFDDLDIDELASSKSYLTAAQYDGETLADNATTSLCDADAEDKQADADSLFAIIDNIAKDSNQRDTDF